MNLISILATSPVAPATGGFGMPSISDTATKDVEIDAVFSEILTASQSVEAIPDTADIALPQQAKSSGADLPDGKELPDPVDPQTSNSLTDPSAPEIGTVEHLLDQKPSGPAAVVQFVPQPALEQLPGPETQSAVPEKAMAESPPALPAAAAQSPLAGVSRSELTVSNIPQSPPSPLPPALGVRSLAAEGRELPMGIEVAEARIESRIDASDTAEPPRGLQAKRETTNMAPLSFTRAPEQAQAMSGTNFASLALPQPMQPGAHIMGAAAANLPGETGADLENMIENLVSARESGRASRGDIVLRHAEFGAVAMMVEKADSELRATLTSRDPGFASAAQAALAERAIAATQDSQSPSQRGNEHPGNNQQSRADTGFDAQSQRRDPSTSDNFPRQDQPGRRAEASTADHESRDEPFATNLQPSAAEPSARFA